MRLQRTVAPARMGMGHLAVAPGYTAPASSLLLSAHASGRYLVNASGTPFLLKGDANWCGNSSGGQTIANVSPGGYYWDNYFTLMQAQGLNSCTLQLISRYQTNAPNDYAGTAPFTSANDIRTPNNTYFARARAFVQLAATYGFVVLIAPCWFGYDSSQGWYDQLGARTNGEIQAYASYVAGYFYDLDNVIWINGGDKPGTVDLRIPDAISAGIRAIDTRHLITAHWNFQTTDAHAGDWRDIVSCYQWDPVASVWQQVQDEYADNDAPVIMLEGRYKDNGIDRQQMRAQAWSAFLSGACGYFYSEEGTWHSGSSDANLPGQSTGKTYSYTSSGALTSEFKDYKNSLEFFSSKTWHLLVPSLSGSSTLITTARGSDDDFISAAKTSTGNLCVVYFANGGSATVALSQLSGTLTTRWYDPSSVAALASRYQTAGAGSYAASGTQSFTVPGNNAAGLTDWVLVLES